MDIKSFKELVKIHNENYILYLIILLLENFK